MATLSSNTCPPNSIPYIVRPGDTINKIAALFNISPALIMASNKNVTPKNILLGQIICIPFDAASIKVCPIGTIPYKIRQGETLATIAKKFSTTVESLLLANPGIRPTKLMVGQIICISQTIPKKPNCPTQNYYVVRKGDIPETISKAFGITVTELINSNPGVNPAGLTEGLILCIPLAPPTVSITVSIAQKILTLYKEGLFIISYPVADGKPSTPTPLGTFTVINKQVNPGGPYGTRWLGLSARGYGIHGTNQPASIGSDSSNGCIRMYNEDIEDLFNMVPVDAVVRIF